MKWEKESRNLKTQRAPGFGFDEVNWFGKQQSNANKL